MTNVKFLITRHYWVEGLVAESTTRDNDPALGLKQEVIEAIDDFATGLNNRIIGVSKVEVYNPPPY